MKTQSESYKQQLKRMLDDPEGLKIIGERLGLELRSQEELKDQPIVAVLVPSYKYLHPNMLDARSKLLRYSAQFCTVFSEPVMGSSVIAWVRNDLVSKLYRERKQFTHVLFIDDDMVFPADVLVKMLRHGKDIVGVNYVGRSDPPTPNIHLTNLETSEARRVLSWNQEGILREGDLISAANERDTLTVGTGLILYSKKALDAVGQMYVNFDYERALYQLTEEQVARLKPARERMAADTQNRLWFDFLPRMCGWGESGEDASFCIKAAMCGYRTYVDTSIRPGHIGEYAYSYADYEPYQDSEIAKAKGQGRYF